MRRLLLTAGIVFAMAGFAGSSKTQDSSMPGMVVSNTAGEQMRLIGTTQPRAAKPVGQSATQPSTNPLLQPYNPNNPYASLSGTGLNVSSVVAPVNGATSSVSPSLFQQVSNSVKSILGITSPPAVQHVYTPGIYRRDRERVRARLFPRD